MNLTQLNRILLQTLLVPVVALMFVATVLAIQIRNAERTVEQLRQAGDNIATATRISELIVDEETGIRGYQITGNEIFLQPYNFAQVPLRIAIDNLREGLAQQGADPGILNGFVNAHETWQIAFADPLIDLVKNDFDTSDAGLNLRAKAQMDGLRDRMHRIMELQQTHRSQTVDAWQHQVHQTLEVLVAVTLIVGIAIGVYARNRLRLVSAAFQRTLDSERRAQITLLATEKAAAAGQLASQLAHEIHNPLDAVSNLLFLLKAGASPEQSREFLDMASNELARATQLSRSILAVTSQAPLNSGPTRILADQSQ